MKMAMACLVSLLLPTVVWAEEAEETKVKEAIQKGLERIKTGVTNYPKHRDCFSCHHQAMAIFSLTAAKKRGFAVEEDLFPTILDFSRKTFKNKPNIAKGRNVGGESVSVVYALQTFATANQPHDETIAALVEYLLVRQQKEGHWTAPVDRPPTMGSPFTNTGLAISVLKKYAPPKDFQDAEAIQKRMDTALEKAKTWLLTNKPISTEDRVFHLRGLVDAGADSKVIEEARDKILQEQRDDGSWSQLPDQDGDAYATATSLVVLAHAGLNVKQDAYQKGIRYLLKTQQEHGAWVVQTRARPVQIYFDNGDAGGRSQFISFAATGWAILALLETLPIKD